MPKRSADGVNRSAEIRKFYEEHPDARIGECISGLSSRGVDVSYGLVASVRSRQPGAGNKSRVGPVTVLESRRVGDFVDLSNLEPTVAVKILLDFADLVRDLGGLDRFRVVLGEYVADGGGSSYMDVNDEDED